VVVGYSAGKLSWLGFDSNGKNSSKESPGDHRVAPNSSQTIWTCHRFLTTSYPLWSRPIINCYSRYTKHVDSVCTCYYFVYFPPPHHHPPRENRTNVTKNVVAGHDDAVRDFANAFFFDPVSGGVVETANRVRRNWRCTPRGKRVR